MSRAASSPNAGATREPETPVTANGQVEGDLTSKLAPPPPNKRKKGRVLLVAAIVGLLAAGLGFAYWFSLRNFESTDDAYIESHVIAISPQVSARVKAVHVNDNDLVKKGDLLVELDSTDYDVALRQAQGMDASARGKLKQAQSQITAAEAGKKEAAASLAVAQVNFKNSNQDLERYKALDEKARSQQQYDNAVAAQQTASAQVAQAEAKVATADSQIETANATVAAAQGDVAKAASDIQRAQVNLDYCRVVAPEEGRVTRKSVEPGAYATPAQPLLALVPPEVWVVANFKETQLDSMRANQAVTISVDAFDGQDFGGKVQSIQAGTGSRFSVLPAENASGNFVKIVQRIPVKITLDNPQLGQGRFLSPGMSVIVKVKVK